MRCCPLIILLLAGLCLPVPLWGQLYYYPESIVQAGPADLSVAAYAVPEWVDWDNDGIKDLIIGEKVFIVTDYGKVRIYLNEGTATAPQFATYTYAQSSGSDLAVPAAGCLGIAPRVIYWDADTRKDLLCGLSDGTVKIFLNIATDSAPAFDAGTPLQVGPPAGKINIDVGSRAVPCVVDWDNDGRKDLIIGAYDGYVRLYRNAGSDAAPDFTAETKLLDGGLFLIVVGNRSAPAVADLNGDAKKDLIVGNTTGELFVYLNVGTNTNPAFNGYLPLRGGGQPIALSPAGLRARPCIADWDNDTLGDLLIGYGDSRVHLFVGTFRSDLNYDKRVNLLDFRVLSNQWLDTINLTADIAPLLQGDDTVDLADFAAFCADWVEPRLP